MLLEAISDSKRLRPETKRLYRSAVGLFIGFCHGERNALAANANVVERWRDAQAAAGIKPETIGVRIRALRFAGRRLHDRGQNDNVFRAATATELLPSTRSKISCPLTLESVRELLASCRGERPVDVRDAAIITLACRTGLRRGGIAAIEIADYQSPKLVVTLKGGRRHELPPLDAETMMALDRWIEVLKENGIVGGKLFRSIRAKRDLKGRLAIGPGMTGKTVYRIIRERGAKIDLQLRAHDTRRFFVSYARAVAGWPDWYTSLWTGHRSSAGFGDVANVPMLDVYTSPIAAAQMPPLPSFI